MRATGLRRATLEQIRAARNYRHAASLPELRTLGLQTTVVQPIARIIDQGSLPACVGCAMCAGAEAALVIPPHLSWVRIWTDARRRDGELRDDSLGTWFSSAIESVLRRGLDPEEPGEWDRVQERTEPDDLDSEMAAFDQRQTDAEHWRVPTGDLDALDDALSRGLTVAMGTGVSDPYFEYFSGPRNPDTADVVLGTDALGGNSNGHEQRIFAVTRVSGIRRYGVQNSWGLAGGCHLPDDSWQPGCCWVKESVLLSAWDIDAIRVTRRTP